MRLRFTPNAWDDLDAISDWLSQHNVQAADRIVERILISVARLESFPDMGRPSRRAGTREWVIRGLPYVAIYRVDRATDQIAVIAILHTSRDRG